MNEVKIPEGYKQAKVGLIPSDWEVFEFGEIVSNTQLGGNYANSIKHTEYPLIKMGNIARGEIKLDKQEYIIGAAQNKDILNYGDVLFNTRNTLELVGKVAIWKNELSVAYFNSNLMRISFSKFHVSTNFFINYLMNSKYFIEELSEIAIGTTSVAAIYSKDLFRIKLPLPSKKEQTAIATALSDVDNLIQSLEKLIAKKEAIKTGAMQQLLTGKTRLPEFATHEDGSAKGFKQTELGRIPEDWGLTNIRDISLVPSQNGLFYEPRRKGSGVPLINVGDMYKSAPIDVDQLELFNATPSEVAVFQVTAGDLLFTRSSIVPSGIAYCNIFESERDDVVFDSHLIKVRPNRKIINPRFLYLNCISKHARTSLIAEAKSAIMTTIDQSAINRCPVLLPSKPEQIAIATILSDMDAEIQTLQQRLEKTKAIKQGMMQQLLTGKVRLAH